jgi:ABC-type Fe3+ transport system permease subunit
MRYIKKNWLDRWVEKMEEEDKIVWAAAKVAIAFGIGAAIVAILIGLALAYIVMN